MYPVIWGIMAVTHLAIAIKVYAWDLIDLLTLGHITNSPKSGYKPEKWEIMKLEGTDLWVAYANSSWASLNDPLFVDMNGSVVYKSKRALQRAVRRGHRVLAKDGWTWRIRYNPLINEDWFLFLTDEKGAQRASIQFFEKQRRQHMLSYRFWLTGDHHGVEKAIPYSYSLNEHDKFAKRLMDTIADLNLMVENWPDS